RGAAPPRPPRPVACGTLPPAPRPAPAGATYGPAGTTSTAVNVVPGSESDFNCSQFCASPSEAAPHRTTRNVAVLILPTPFRLLCHKPALAVFGQPGDLWPAGVCPSDWYLRTSFWHTNCLTGVRGRT